MPGKNLIQAINVKRYIVTVLFAVLAVAAPAFAIQTELSSNELFPGDAFSIRISELPSSDGIDTAINGLQIPLGSCGEDCLFGIGIIPPETAPGETSIDLNAGGRLSKVSITVKKPVYPELHLKLPDKKVSLSPEDLARAKDEEQRLKTIWQIRNEKLYDGAFIMPLSNLISAYYGAKRIINNKNVSVHRGIDIKGALGEEVKASNRGRVVLTEELFFGGNTIVIDHGLGIYTVYMHLDSFSAKTGRMVEKGQIIGFVGSTGRSTGPHLHFGLKILTFNANPVSIMGISLE
jgi:murein DD-endopeptidase MepM/ murein hydrolase activator NlpD